MAIGIKSEYFQNKCYNYQAGSRNIVKIGIFFFEHFDKCRSKIESKSKNVVRNVIAVFIWCGLWIV